MILLRRRALTGGDMPSPGPGPGPTPGGSAAGDLLVGQTVAIKESGTPIPYLVVHQGNPDAGLYDASCEGTWLLRKDIAEKRAFDSGNSNVLETSDIQVYLNGNWMDRYDPQVAEAIKTVKIPYRQNGGSGGTNRNGANGLSCKIFLLSSREVGFTNNESSYFPNDGSKLDYFISGNTSSAKQRRVANLNGSATGWLLRSPNTIDGVFVWSCNSSGDCNSWSANYSVGVRPALILPYDYQFEESEVIA